MWGNSPRGLIVAVAVVLFVAITALRFLAGDDPSEPYTLLYVLPIALLANAFGIPGGLSAACAAVALAAGWAAINDVSISAEGWAIRVVTFALVGVGFGMLHRLRIREELRSSRWFAMSNDMLAEAGFNGYFTRVNGAWTAVLGYAEDELLSRPYLELVHPDDRQGTVEAAAGLAGDEGDLVGFENRFRAKDGSWRWLLWSARSDSDRVYAVAKDITDRKLAEGEREDLLTRVEAIARTDELTGLPNRRAWNDELHRAVLRGRRHHFDVSVAVIDLDHFKAFNDEHGHPAGDRMLHDAATDWRLALRSSDFIARIGGEEFALLLPGCPPTKASQLIERVRDATPGGQTCSAGIAHWDGVESPESLVERADAALYEAKRLGRDRSETALV